MSNAAAPQQPARRRPLWQEAVVVLAAALALAFVVKTFFVQAFYIPSGSMEPTLRIGDKLLVQKVSYWSGSPHRGDVVVFDDPGGWLPDDSGPTRNPVKQVLQTFGLLPSGGHLVKRVIGVAGDTVSCCDVSGRLRVNGRSIDEPYLENAASNRRITFTVTVQRGYLWVEGDNRGHSADSRYHLGDPGGGQVPVADVVGKVWLRAWPFDRFGVVPGTDAFDDVRSRRS